MRTLDDWLGLTPPPTQPTHLLTPDEGLSPDKKRPLRPSGEDRTTFIVAAIHRHRAIWDRSDTMFYDLRYKREVFRKIAAGLTAEYPSYPEWQTDDVIEQWQAQLREYIACLRTHRTEEGHTWFCRNRDLNSFMKRPLLACSDFWSRPMRDLV